MKTPATNPSWGLTVLRLVVGSVFVVHGAQKLFQVGLAGLAGISGSLHIPLPLVSAVFATLVEFVVGIALLLGVFTRWAAALIASELLVAVLVKLMLKDARLIEKFGESLQSPIPALRVAKKNFASAVALGFGKENASALIKALEKEAGVEVKARPAS
jgi:uncharacterized membrane protein YphA (DoxX/SURF4 family)